MQKSYFRNYLSTYFWRVLSLCSGILSLLVVVPIISEDKSILSVYAVCMSITLFLTYSDLGFIESGQKFAAEAYAKNNLNNELKYTGFTLFILIIMIIPYSLLMLILANDTELIFKNISNEHSLLAKKIFYLLAILYPFQFLIQRTTQIILGIRIKIYVQYRIEVPINIIKTLSIFIFIKNGQLQLYNYLLFTFLISIFGGFIILIIIYKFEKYKFLSLIQKIKFDKRTLETTKKLAISSFLLTFGWVLFYELDLFIISRLISFEAVAIYSIAFTFLNFLRSLWNTVFMPFTHRFNHFVTNDSNELKIELLSNIIKYSYPLAFFVTSVLIISSDYFIIYWVGKEYLESVPILNTLILTTFFTFILTPSSYYFISIHNTNYLKKMAYLYPIIFFIGVVILFKYDELSLAYSKLITITIVSSYTMYILYRKIHFIKIVYEWLPIFIAFGVTTYFYKFHLIDKIFVNDTKSTVSLLKFLTINFSYLSLWTIICFIAKRNNILQYLKIKN